MKKVDIHIEICKEGIKIPQYAKLGDAGLDIRAAENINILPNETKIIPTGIKVAIPEGYEIQVRPRSGLSVNTPLRISNSPGTIDSGFRNEIGIIINNTSNTIENTYCASLTIEEKGNRQGIYEIKKGDRIAQLVLKEVPTINWVVVDSVKDIGTDRQGGFGSSGVK
jgi:dUTP pyrophosphatase